MGNQSFAMSKSLMEGPGEDRFEFAPSHGVNKEALSLGHFQLDCRQKSLAVGEFITWTKGFQCSGADGKADQGGSWTSHTRV